MGVFVEGSKAEHVEAGPVSGRMFQRLAGHPFPPAVSFSSRGGRSDGGEKPSRCICVCVRLTLSAPDRALRALGLAAPQHREACWPGWWLCESHGRSRVAENIEHNLWMQGRGSQLRVFYRDFGELFLLVDCRRVVFILLAVWVFSTLQFWCFEEY